MDQATHKENGYDFKTKDENVPDEYQCMICHLLIRSFTELSNCGHTYCRACLEKWEQTKIEESINSKSG